MARPVLLASRPWTTAVVCGSILALTLHLYRSRRGQNRDPIRSPRAAIAARLSEEDAQALPYPPDCFPGRRDIDTLYGSVRVYEWGPADGERILFVHGISLPCVSLGDLAEQFALRGYRVILFDLYGRGYSDAPQNVPYNSQLYTNQMLSVLQSSPVNWLDDAGFHLIGYSLGGGLSVPFARRFPDHLRSLTLITPCGLIRPHHIDWKGKLLYKWNLLPASVVRRLVRRRIDVPEPTPANANTPMQNQDQSESNRTGDASGGASYDFAPISRHRPHVTVNDVLSWQLRNHDGFINAFTSTMSHAPIYHPVADWTILASILREERRLSRVLIVLGASDPVILRDEIVEDAERVLGRDHVGFVVLDSGHEVPFTQSKEVAEGVVEFWNAQNIK